MAVSLFHDTASKSSLLTGLAFAISEARMTRSLIRQKKRGQINAAALEKLSRLDQEIDYLETTLTELTELNLDNE